MEVCQFSDSGNVNIRIEDNYIKASYFAISSNDSLLLDNVSFKNNRAPSIRCYLLGAIGSKIKLSNSELINNEAGYFANVIDAAAIIPAPKGMELYNVKIICNSKTSANSINLFYLTESFVADGLQIINSGNISITSHHEYKADFYAKNLQIINSGDISIVDFNKITIVDSKIAYNTSGLNLNGSTVEIEGTSIHNNMGTGLLCAGDSDANSNINLSTVNLNSIYNNRGTVRDIKISSWDSINLPVVLDTFSTKLYTLAYTNWGKEPIPVTANTYTIENVNADLYVSPGGSDNNSGLSTAQPFRTISHALDVIFADTLNPKTIHLAAGTYSVATNGETFPIVPSHAVSIIGDDPQNTIIEGDGNSPVLDIGNIWIDVYRIGNPPFYQYEYVPFNQRLLLRNLTITGGVGEDIEFYINTGRPIEGAINIEEAKVRFENCIIGKNVKGGVFNSYANSVFVNCTIADTSMSYRVSSSTKYINCVIDEVYPIYNYGSINTLENVDLDTIFTDPQNGDYTLFEGSVAIDAGIAYYEDASGNVLINLDSTQYTRNAPDLGAIESDYVSGINSVDEIPQSYSLAQNYPNPFNPKTTISYSIPSQLYVTLKIYDLLGNEVKTLVNEKRSSGKHIVEFDGTGLASGIYFYRLQAGSYMETKKLILLK